MKTIRILAKSVWIFFRAAIVTLIVGGVLISVIRVTVLDHNQDIATLKQRLDALESRVKK